MTSVPTEQAVTIEQLQAERAAAEALRVENAQLAKELLIARTQIAGLREIRRNRYRFRRF